VFVVLARNAGLSSTSVVAVACRQLNGDKSVLTISAALTTAKVQFLIL
jgi:hypothetical protein